ncbi:MAG: NUDIX hydrolase [Planctomycetota bacterium]
MKHCNQCGGLLAERVPKGEDRKRKVCTVCEHVHYQNPLVVVGCVVEHGDQVLLCRRAIEPAHGKWTIPAGFLELGETMAQGAARETWEEACAKVAIQSPHSHLELTHIGQLHMTYRAQLAGGAFAAGEESLECQLFHEHEVPWSEMAFPAGIFALRLLFEDRKRGTAHLHQGDLKWNGEGSRFDPANYLVDGHLRTRLG